MKNFDYITNYLPGKKSAKIAIKKPIDKDGTKGINGDDFAKEMDFLAEVGVEEVVIEINSIGGSIKEGFSIFSAIKDAPFKTVTRVVGIAASMAGIISQAGDKRVIMDYGIFHAHGPQVPSGKKVDGDLLSKMLGSLKTMIGTKANLTEVQVSEILGKETVLTALEAKEMGFFDEIEISRGAKPELSITNNLEALYEMANIYINKNEKMDKLNEFLQLENATEADIIAKITEVKEANETKVEELTNELSELKESKSSLAEELTNELRELKESNEVKVEELTNEVNELKKQAAENVVNAAIKSGKIKEDSRGSWIDQATNDLKKTEELLSSFSGVTKAVNLKNEIKPEGKKENGEDRKEWDFQQWSQEDPKGLEQLKADYPEKFDSMLNKYLED